MPIVMVSSKLMTLTMKVSPQKLIGIQTQKLIKLLTAPVIFRHRLTAVFCQIKCQPIKVVFCKERSLKIFVAAV